MNYESFQELCNEATGDAPFDIQPFDFFSSEAEVDSGVVTELLQTGSVTVEVRGKKYVISLNVQEET